MRSGDTDGRIVRIKLILIFFLTRTQKLNIRKAGRKSMCKSSTSVWESALRCGRVKVQ
jgi:hypothetical protein